MTDDPSTPAAEAAGAPEAAEAQAAPFGARFLDSYRSNGGSMLGLSFQKLQELKLADREQFIRHLRRSGSTFLTYQVTQRFRREEPEALGAWVANEQRFGRLAMGLWLFAFLT